MERLEAKASEVASNNSPRRMVNPWMRWRCGGGGMKGKVAVMVGLVTLLRHKSRKVRQGSINELIFALLFT